MLKITIHNLGNATIFRCTGRITVQHADLLRMTVLKQAPLSIVVLDLAEITAMDAAGVGALVSLHWWATAIGARLKLMNLTPRVQELLELFNLRSAFEICSVVSRSLQLVPVPPPWVLTQTPPQIWARRNGPKHSSKIELKIILRIG